MVLFLNVTVYKTGVGQTRERIHINQSVVKRDHFPLSLGKDLHVKQLKESKERDVFVPVMVPRMCANESPTSSTDTPEALSEAISRSSFDKRLVSM